MIRGVRFFPNNLTLNFMRLRFVGYVVSAVIVLGSIGALSVKGLNFGIDFTGGMLVEVRLDNPPQMADLRSELGTLGLGDISIQEFGAPTDILIRVAQQEGGPEAQKAAERSIRGVVDALQETQPDYRRVEFVGPQVGAELIESGVLAVIFSILGILAYVSFRFEWQFGGGAVLALIHDVIAIMGFFAITGKQFDLATVAAILTIAGYSINDTVVIFDRVRENLRKFKKLPLVDLLNKSLSETLSRTILTSLTTLLALIALWSYGGEVIRGFVDALIVGVVVGTYSTIFVASPTLLNFNLRFIDKD